MYEGVSGALESALTTAMDEWGPTPRRGAQKPRNGGGDDALRVLANRREKTDADAERAEFWLSGTHAVKKRKGQGDVTTHERLLILNGFWIGLPSTRPRCRRRASSCRRRIRATSPWSAARRMGTTMGSLSSG